MASSVSGRGEGEMEVIRRERVRRRVWGGRVVVVAVVDGLCLEERVVGAMDIKVALDSAMSLRRMSIDCLY